MSWIERNHYFKEKVCIVCRRSTRQFAAPMGIVSGTVPCHHRHENEQIMAAYLATVHAMFDAQGKVIEDLPF